MIRNFTLVANGDAKTFTDDLNKEIDKFQSMGFKVEVQYSISNTYFSALVIARGKC